MDKSKSGLTFPKIVNQIPRVVFGLFFLFSGYTKLFPIESFELTFVHVGLFSWSQAPLIARIIIGLELFLGLAITFNLSIRKILISSLLLLLIFSIYLGYLLLTSGDDINCGCFGAEFSMSPSESLVKNAILILLNLFLLKKSNPLKNQWKWIFPLIAIVGLVGPFILNPIAGSSQNVHQKMEEQQLDLSKIPSPVQNGEEIDLTKGKKIIAFLSVDCNHCKHAAYKLQIAKEKYKIENIYFVFKGKYKEQKLQAFYHESNSNLPYSFYNDMHIFELTGGVFPTIVLLDNSRVVKAWSGGAFTPQEVGNLPLYLERE